MSSEIYDHYKATMPPLTLHTAIAGLGRMGKRHADHFLHKVPRSTLVAVCSPDPVERQWANQHLAPYGVTVYEDFGVMIRHHGLQAVIIASVTTVHAAQSIAAIDAGLHVLCEKPLSTDAAIARTVIEAAAWRPELKVMCGFSRRFDDSYRDAHRKVGQGAVGRPSVFRSQTCDKLDKSGFFVQFARQSGGIFVDCSIHDIDLCLWFFGDTARVKSVSAVGITAVHPPLKDSGDRDNAVGLVEFHDERVAYFYASRMMAAGQEDVTEIIGTEGKISVNATGSVNHVQIHEEGGVRRELPQTYFDRFEKAFVTEAVEFTRCCLDDERVPVPLAGAVKAVEIGGALQESLRTGRKIWFGEGGGREERASL